MRHHPSPFAYSATARSGPRRRALLLAPLAAALPHAACVAETGSPRLARPVPLELPPGAPFEPLGALVLDAGAIGFGGLSGLHLAPDWRVTAVSDLGFWMSATIALDAAGRPAGLSGLRTGRLQDGAGGPLARGHSGDAESLARLPDGTWLVGFERWHRIRAFRGGLDAPGAYVDAPRTLAAAPANGGLEAMAALPDGRLLLIAERIRLPGVPPRRAAWVGRPGAWLQLRYRPSGVALDPVDAAALPGGDVLVLERGFSWIGGFTGRLVRIPAAALAAPTAATLLEGEVLLRLEAPLPPENYEGVATARIGGRTVVALVSDDNEFPLQSTWLLLLALADG